MCFNGGSVVLSGLTDYIVFGLFGWVFVVACSLDCWVWMMFI